jgi:hypothetical protein
MVAHMVRRGRPFRHILCVPMVVAGSWRLVLGGWFSSGSSLLVLVYLSMHSFPHPKIPIGYRNQWILFAWGTLRTRDVVCSGCVALLGSVFRVGVFVRTHFRSNSASCYNYSYLVVSLSFVHCLCVGNRVSRESCSSVAGLRTMVVWVLPVTVDDFVVTYGFCLSSLPISVVRHYPELRMQSLEGMDGKERYHVRTVWMDGWMQVERAYGQTDSAEQAVFSLARSKNLENTHIQA